MTTPAPAIASYVPTYASRTPYITTAEYTSAPTAVDASNLVQGGNTQQNASELSNMIGRASSVADVMCHQVLAATLDVQAGQYRVQRGLIKVPVDNTPIIAVIGVNVGYQAGQLTPLGDLSGLWIQRKVVTIPVASVSYITVASLASIAAAGSVLAEVSYINGFPNSLLAASATQGASSVVVESGLGIYPGSVLTVYDDQPGAEQVTVDSTYVIGSTTVPLVDPLMFGHAYGVSVSALPPAIKQAVIAITSALIKTRGNQSMVMASITKGPSSSQKMDKGAQSDFEYAGSLLKPFARVQ